MLKKIVLSILGVAGLFALGVTGVNAQLNIIRGQQNPAVDVPAVQAAVSKGGEVLLGGIFDFGEKGSVTITKDVQIIGMGTPYTLIKGGFWTFHSPLPAKLPPEVPGPKITIMNILFDGTTWSPICLAYSSGASILNCKIINLKPKASELPIFGKEGLNNQQGIIYSPIFAQPSQNWKYIPNLVTGNLIIEGNDIDMINDESTKTMAQGVVVIWGTGINARIQNNTIRNCTRNSIETIDNYLGENGSGLILIKDNKITTPQVGLPVPTPNTPNGIVAGWFLDLSGGLDPKRNSKHIIMNNSVKAQGQMSAGIAALSDGIVIGDNTVATDGSGASPIFLAGSHGIIGNNKIEGKGFAGILAMPWDPLKAINNLVLDNDFKEFKASSADVLFQKGTSNNLLLGRGGTFSNLGSENQIDGMKPVAP